MNSTEQNKDTPLILVVDDDKFTRIQLRKAMEQAGYQVAEAGDGEEGLSAYTRLRPDIVLLDAMMPVMDGFTCCHLLNTLSKDNSAARGENTPVLMITALDDQESVDQAFEAGAIDYITKPIHWAVLRQRVRRLLQASRAAAELQQQTERTRLSEERLRLALEAAQMGSWDWDIENGKVVYSSNTEASLGLAPGSFEATYEGFLESVHPEDRNLVTQAVQRALEQGADYDIEFRVIWTDGSLHWVATKGQVYYNQTGSVPVRMTGIDMDITERKHSEQKIREQAALLDIATDAIIVQNLENQILFWSKGAECLYGWNKEEAVGKNTNELLYKQTPSQLQEYSEILFAYGEWYGELHQVTKSGQVIIVESRWTLVRDDQEKPKAVLIVNTDITEKKQLERQFLRGQRLESLGTLASGIAHDLNNVLAPVLMSVQLLQLKLQDEQSKHLLSILETNTKRGADLVKQVLSFAKGIEGERTTIQVGHLILELKKIVQETFPKSIQLCTDIQTRELWTISGDATQLHQVLMNLCVNARDAMPNGGVLKICAENIIVDENYARMIAGAKVGSHIVVTVSDTGVGMSSDILDRIFEPFFTTKELGKGTGLGLSTVLGIVKSHGGFINVYSEVGKGTEFKVYLPAVQAKQVQQVEKDESKLPNGQGELILVVDDEASIAEVTKTSLETYAYRVLTASDGIEAVLVYAQHKEEISVVLLDMMMPSMDGPTTIRTLQKINPQVKVIAVSGLASKERVTEVANLGIKNFLSKPYTTQQLLQSLNEVISR
ncbi:response regulator [Funiculus sociatus GB2-A5]|uniref:histidine kinase n=1 Tax=Funiculus sociatus GB2-A5 TaxID=2933946 RepID=A0ABV0JNG7_9CYAN|nr:MULTISPECIES: response regulator [unclassified Trichocoleus]MBD1904236.1 response regulator [Trichocoleus sp. FACHB-832]MBD2064142.1 response regulator [Trichocoleus sp. FACHB-6]